MYYNKFQTPSCYGESYNSECDLDCPWAADCSADMQEDEDDEEIFDRIHCPMCNSISILKIGTTEGQDVGDNGEDSEIWKCLDCSDSWLTDIMEQGDKK